MQVWRAEDLLQEMSYALLQERHERTDTPGDEVRWSQDDVVSSFGSGQTPVREIKAGIQIRIPKNTCEEIIDTVQTICQQKLPVSVILK